MSKRPAYKSYSASVTDALLNEKQNTLVSGTDIKTINGESLLGSGDINIQEGTPTAVLYTEQILSEEEKAQAKANLGIINSEISSDFEFTVTDLIDNKLEIYHGKSTKNIVAIPYDSLDMQVIPKDVKIISENSIELDFTGLVITDTWRVVVQGGDAVVDGIAVVDNAVLYVPQTLSSEQKQQTKSNLGLVEDLQNVADLIPVNISELTNDVSFITNVVSDLENYYDKNEIDVIVSAISQLLTYSVVVELPTVDIKTNVIYLVLVEGSTSNYSMNMYIDSSWYVLGETTIDLSQYVTLVEYNARIAILESALAMKTNNTTIKVVLDSDLTTNTEYVVNLSADTTIASATGWGSISVTALGNFTITIPDSHKWADGLDGYIENGTQVMVMYDNGRWSRIDWR